MDPNDDIGGIARISGVDFAFPTDHGFGLVCVSGLFYVVNFSCPLESCPPKGSGMLVTGDTELRLSMGRLFWKDHELQLGRRL